MGTATVPSVKSCTLKEKNAGRGCIKVFFSCTIALIEFHEKLLEVVWFSFGMPAEMVYNSMGLLKHLYHLENGKIVIEDWTTFPLTGQCKKSALSFINCNAEAKFFDYQVSSCLRLYKAAYISYDILQQVQ